MKPNDTGGECLRCGTDTVAVGYGHSVLGLYCEHCDLLVTIEHETMKSSEAIETFDDDHDKGEAYNDHENHVIGPDPNP